MEFFLIVHYSIETYHSFVECNLLHILFLVIVFYIILEIDTSFTDSRYNIYFPSFASFGWILSLFQIIHSAWFQSLSSPSNSFSLIVSCVIIVHHDRTISGASKSESKLSLSHNFPFDNIFIKIIFYHKHFFSSIVYNCTIHFLYKKLLRRNWFSIILFLFEGWCLHRIWRWWKFAWTFSGSVFRRVTPWLFRAIEAFPWDVIAIESRQRLFVVERARVAHHLSDICSLRFLILFFICNKNSLLLIDFRITTYLSEQKLISSIRTTIIR